MSLRPAAAPSPRTQRSRLGAATASYLVAAFLVPAVLGAIGFAIVRGAL